MTAPEKLPPLWEMRSNGSRYPNPEAENAILGMRTQKGAAKPGFENEKTLGDLILEVLIPNWSPFRSFEHEFIIESARELRAVLVAAHEGVTSEDLVASFTRDDADLALHCITERMEAGAELLARIKSARGLKTAEVSE